MVDAWPVVGVCGYSGAGKTTLILALVKEFQARGLRVAVLKHDAHGLDVDREGKDSDRFFRAGADVVARGPGQGFVRFHDGPHLSLDPVLCELASRYDLILVEGHKADASFPKIWLKRSAEEVPPQAPLVRLVLEREQDRLAAARAFVSDRLAEGQRLTPVLAGLLIGGASTRMGRPKHLLRSAGRTWVEHAAAAVAPVVDGVVVLGPGRMPAALGELPRLPDVAGVGGPLAGFHAAMRWQPFATWLFLACDMPLVSPEAVQWLLGQRAPGVWAVLPRRAGGGVEPLFAWYGFRARALLGSCRGPSEIAAHPKVRTPLVPPHLASAWENANTPADRRRLCRTVPAHRGPQCCASPDPRVSGRVARLQCR